MNTKKEKKTESKAQQNTAHSWFLLKRNSKFSFSRMLAYSIFLSRILANKTLSIMLTYSYPLFITRPTLVIREITVCYPLKWNKHNKQYLQTHTRKQKETANRKQAFSRMLADRSILYSFLGHQQKMFSKFGT